MIRLLSYFTIPLLVVPLALASTSSNTGSSTHTGTQSSARSSSASKDDDPSSPFPTLHAVSNEGYVYYVNVSVGSEEETIGLRIDIAQPYIWLRNSDSLPECSSDTENSSQCETLGAFNFENSSSYVDFNDHQDYLTLDGIEINGTFGQDNFNISVTNGESTPISLSNMDFLNADNSSVVVGGLGLSGKVTNLSINQDYSTFLDALKDDKQINSSSFSLYTKDNETAKLIFGGINQDYYTGDLVQFNKIPYLDENNVLQYSYPIIPLTGLSVSNSKGEEAVITSSNTTEAVLLDTRVTSIYLPYDMVVSLAVQLNAIYYQEANTWLLRCNIGELGANFNMKFGNLTIAIPISKMVGTAYANDSDTLQFDNGDEACILLVKPNYYFGYSVIGTPFFQQAYLAVDNEGNTLALAQAVNDTAVSLSSSSQNSTKTTDFAKSAISSGYIPFAKTNNVTQQLTFSYADIATASYLQPDVVTASIDGNEIFTGRTQRPSSTAPPSSSTVGAGNRLLNNNILLAVPSIISPNLTSLIFTLLSVLGLALLL